MFSANKPTFAALYMREGDTIHNHPLSLFPVTASISIHPLCSQQLAEKLPLDYSSDYTSAADRCFFDIIARVALRATFDTLVCDSSGDSKRLSVGHAEPLVTPPLRTFDTQAASVFGRFGGSRRAD